MSVLYLMNYNNYYNRRMKGLGKDNPSDYPVDIAIPNINFNVGDGVEATQVVNIPDRTELTSDYLLVCSTEGGAIQSRWFILESKWNRQHQFTLTLRRDVLVDKYNGFKDNQFYCERGMVSGMSDPLVFNSEGIDFNQVLQKRVLLKQTQNQNGRYIIGYVDKTWRGGRINYINPFLVVDTFDQLPFYDVYQGKTVVADSFDRAIMFYAVSAEKQFVGNDKVAYGPIVRFKFSTMGKGNGHSLGPAGVDRAGSGIGCNNMYHDDERKDAIVSGIEGLSDVNFSDYDAIIMNKLPANVIDYEEYRDWNNKTIVVGDKLYRIKFTAGPAAWRETVNIGTDLANQLSKVWMRATDLTWEYDLESDKSYYIYGQLYYRKYNLELEEVEPDYITIPAVRPGDETLPYNIFCIPDSETARQFAGYFASQFAGGNVLYDIQLFPYAPDTTDQGAVEIAPGVTLKWATSASKHGKLYHEAIQTYATAKQMKIGANQHTCRLVSPDMSSMWDFNPSQIGGVAANSINYEFTLMPYSPSLHIFPTFGGIYGSINKDWTVPYAGESRGLTCTGSYSMPYSTSAWATYKLQNSAYMDAFNRRIENMSITQNYERVQQIAGIVGGVASGAISGAIGGGVAGAIGGGVASAIGGVVDYALSEGLRAEQVGFARDQFSYSMRNIQAQAQPLASTPSMTEATAYFPFIELYKATEEEETAFSDKLKYSGYLIGRMSTFATQVARANRDSKYIQGRLVNIDINDDTHICNEIAKELYRGVFVE